MYVVIAGAGKVGWNLARELIGKGNEVTVIGPARQSNTSSPQRIKAHRRMVTGRPAALCI